MAMLIDLEAIATQNRTGYPEPYRALVAGRFRKRLGDAAGLTNFGVNWVKLEPGSASAQRHWHQKQDELIYVLEGELTLITNAGEQILQPGMAAGFPAGVADGHHLVNRSNLPAIYLEVGDRTPDDTVIYPDIDLQAHDSAQGWVFTHADSTPW